MIYVSSACVRNNFIWESVEELAIAGFKNIELSGGTKRSDHTIENLLDVQDKYNLCYRCHNYFPPPEDDFVMNLASKSDEIYNKTTKLISEAINYSTLFGSDKYAFHAGFLTDITIKEIGKRVNGRPLDDKNQSLDRFVSRVQNIINNSKDIKLYIENNVISNNNFINFQNQNPFLLTSYIDFIQLKEVLDFNLLLDVGHLYVSSTTLDTDFQSEFSALIELTDYVHISDNNGLADENKGLKIGSDIHTALLNSSLENKTFTLEVNDGLVALEHTYNIVENLIT